MLHDTLAAIARTGRLDTRDTDLDALTDTILGAVTENALVIATSPDPASLTAARTRACVTLLQGMLRPGTTGHPPRG